MSTKPDEYKWSLFKGGNRFNKYLKTNSITGYVPVAFRVWRTPNLILTGKTLDRPPKSKTLIPWREADPKSKGIEDFRFEIWSKIREIRQGCRRLRRFLLLRLHLHLLLRRPSPRRQLEHLQRTETPLFPPPTLPLLFPLPPRFRLFVSFWCFASNSKCEIFFFISIWIGGGEEAVWVHVYEEFKRT